MISTKNLNRISQLIFLLLILIVLGVSIQYEFINKTKNDFLIPPPNEINHLSFGNSEVLSDILWLRTIQNFDYCESRINDSDCVSKGWLYKMLDLVTDLSPKFRMPYAVGGLMLSLAVADIQGASEFFEKGVKTFPNDWPIQYRAAFHYMYSDLNNKKAAELLIMAGKNGAPDWVNMLASTLFIDDKKLELAESLLRDLKKTSENNLLIEKIEQKIKKYKITGEYKRPVIKKDDSPFLRN